MTTTAPQSTSARRYSSVAIFLHWTIALLIFIQIGLGWYMNEVLPDHSPAQEQVETLHISVGLTMLLLVLVRIVWRLTHPAPPLPAGMPTWERLLAHAVHVVFYLLMLALPLTGWAMASSHKGGIEFWGLPWPHLPGVEFLTAPENRPLRRTLQHVHVNLLIWVVFANLALHVLGGLKHQFDGRPVLWRMIPFLTKPS